MENSALPMTRQDFEQAVETLTELRENLSKCQAVLTVGPPHANIVKDCMWANVVIANTHVQLTIDYLEEITAQLYAAADLLDDEGDDAREYAFEIDGEEFDGYLTSKEAFEAMRVALDKRGLTNRDLSVYTKGVA